MKILLCNKFYYRRGGDCIVTMNIEQMLKSKGHEVAIYSMDYPENVESPWKKYWPSNMSKLDAFTRPFGAKQVKDGFTRLLDDFHPDVVHLHNIHTHLSPVIAEIAHKRGIRVVWTLHDTKLVCPCYTCMRREQPHPNPRLKGGYNYLGQGGKMEWCEECFKDKKAVIKHKCMPGGVIGSTIGYYEQKVWNKDRLQACTDLFLPPSQFMADTCIRGGYDADKFKVLCNFINIDKVKNPNFEKGDYYCFLGRVTEVKGIRTLCKASSQLPYKLKVIGGGDLLDELKGKYPDVEFLGQMNWDEFRPVLEGAKFMVLPAEWSENNPLTVIEAQSLGTPVLGARIGGIPELITDKSLTVNRLTVNDKDDDVNNRIHNGMTFESGDVEDLKGKILKMWDAEFDYAAIARDAVARYSNEAYYEKLMRIYKC